MGNRSFLAAWSAFALVFFGCSSCGEKRMLASRTEAFAENGRRNLTLIFTGDLMQHMPQVFAARQRDGSFDYTSCFSRLNNYFSSADFVIANLETTLGEEPYSGYPRFRSPEALAGAMRRAGVDVAVLANNHCCDNGAEGIRTSVEELDRCGIRHTGAFADSADYNKNNPLYLTYCGIRLAIVNYTYGTNGMPVPEGTVVNLIDTVRMAADLAAARASGVDFIVACVHWGDEYQRRENAAQRSLAAFLRRHGTDVVVGSHPHVIQPWVADSSHVVLYSLGNLVSGQRRRYTDGGLVATVEAVRHPEGRMTYRLETTPVWVSVPGYRILTPEAADTMTLPAAYGIFRADLDALPGNGL